MNVNNSDTNPSHEDAERQAPEASKPVEKTGLLSRGIKFVRGAVESWSSRSMPNDGDVATADSVEAAGTSAEDDEMLQFSDGGNAGTGSGHKASRRDFLKIAAALAAAAVLPNSGCDGPIEAVKEVADSVLDIFEEAGRDTGEMLENIGREFDLLRRKLPLIGNESPISASRILKASKTRSNEDEKLLGEAYDAARPKIVRAMPSLKSLPKGRDRDILLSYMISLYVTKEVLDRYNEQCSKRGAISRSEDLDADYADHKIAPGMAAKRKKIAELESRIESLSEKPSNPILDRQIDRLSEKLMKLRNALDSDIDSYNGRVSGHDEEEDEALGVEIQIAEVLSGLKHGLAQAEDEFKDRLEEEREKAREEKK